MSDNKQMSFLDHLEELRWRLMRSAVAVIIFAIVIWIYQKEIMENVFLIMVDPNFVTFRLLCEYLNVCIDKIPVNFQSMTLSGQFSYALMMSIMGGAVLAFPYIFYQLWSFVKPGLKFKERKLAKGIVFYVSILFFTGILFGYFVVAPLSVQFFGAFQITDKIRNDFTISSYMSTILSTVFYTGLFFLLPVVTYLLVKIGLFTPEFLIKYRKHAVVVILILAAIITPPDVISQVIVTIPIYLLFEVSVLVAKRVAKNQKD
jgi:sec-independent protein translocase protein TatC